MAGISGLAVDRRRNLASHIRNLREQIAGEVTRQSFERHPGSIDPDGEQGWRSCLEDTRSHLDFLASAVEAGLPQLFEDYSRWKSRVLSARGTPAAFLVESLRRVETALLAQLEDPESRLVLSALFATACLAAEAPRDYAVQDWPSPSRTDRSLFVRSILDGDRRAALAIAREALRREATVCDVYVDLIEAAMREIGMLWERNQISVAHEHGATAVVQTVLAQLHADLPPAGACHGRMLITGVQGEMHQIGALMAADVIENSGWTVRYLGSNLPAGDIVQAVCDFNPSVVGISVTMPFNLSAARELIMMIRRDCPNPVPRVIVGGRAFAALQNTGDTGADEYVPDLRAAVRLFSSEA